MKLQCLHLLYIHIYSILFSYDLTPKWRIAIDRASSTQAYVNKMMPRVHKNIYTKLPSYKWYGILVPMEILLNERFNIHIMNVFNYFSFASLK